MADPRATGLSRARALLQAHRRGLVIVLAAVVAAVVLVSAVWAAGRPWIRHGVHGQVRLLEGDCMPVTTPLSCRESPVSRTVFVRDPVASGAMDGTYLREPTPLIATTTSFLDGQYEVALPPGRYSVFAEDDGREYCNAFDGEGFACLVEVGAGPVAFDITIDHASH